MICPIMSAIAGLSFQKASEPDTNFVQCQGKECAWYEEYFGKCCMTVFPYLKGEADHLGEIRPIMRDRY